MLYDSIEPLPDRRIYEQLVYLNMIQMQANAAEGAAITWEDAALKYDQAPGKPQGQTPEQIYEMMEFIGATMRADGE